MYENHICELRSKELFEGRSSQLYTQLMQLRKESLSLNLKSSINIHCLNCLFVCLFFFFLSLVQLNVYSLGSLQVLRIFTAPRQFMETFQGLCKVQENNKACSGRLSYHLHPIGRAVRSSV